MRRHTVNRQTDKRFHRNGYNKEEVLTSMMVLVEGSLPGISGLRIEMDM